MVVGINAVNKYKYIKEKNKKIGDIKTNEYKIIFPKETMIGALAKYIQEPNEKFQPMNANFGILPELDEKIRDKKVKYSKLADRAIEKLKNL